MLSLWDYIFCTCLFQEFQGGGQKLKQKIMKKIFCYSMLLCFLSCNEHALNSDKLSIERETFISGKNVNEQKEKFLNLPFQQRRDIWIGKINQIITVKGMSEQHYVIISSILDIFKNAENENTLFNNSQLEDLAVSLAEITPQADYIEMFEKLSDYEFSGFKVTATDRNTNSKFASVVKNDFENLKQDRAISTSHSRTTNEAADCNCRWSCGDDPSQCTHSNCNTTSWGCGFLWLMSCERRDEIFAENCP